MKTRNWLMRVAEYGPPTLLLVTLATLALVTDSSRGQAPPAYRQQQAHPQVSTFDVVEARKFVLRDASGLARVEIGPNANGNAIGVRILDRQGKLRLNLAVANDGDLAGVSLIDAQGEDRVAMMLSQDEAAVALRGRYDAGITESKAKGTFFVVGKGEEDTVVLGVDAAGNPVRQP
jgi:hypothetical protein